MRTTSQAEIQHHYDAGNDFYAMWLDRRMIYSAALFRSDTQSLEEAQIEKLRFHADAAGARPGARILDVGCGWGAMLRYLVEERNVADAVGLTLSAAQKERFDAGNADPRARMAIVNWQDYHDPRPFDGIVSIGAFEHFGRFDHRPEERLAVYAEFFDFCRRRLNKGGKLSLQTIAYGRIRKLTPIQRDKIWRESELPMAHEVLEAASRWFEPERLVNHRLDYARTLREWERRLGAAKARAETLVGPEKVADYLAYLDDAASGFENGAIQLLRIAFRRH
ncbi:cyclopropane-fatty-acyl-phospholipid synthase [Roseiarcus fermentans]|uniref:Cyclopropane-fatty-acyl-phospholipid synthase n=1 Tax=Roseiarcus fermentans TaxID=1473586 RepID=A0A366FC88_9HYPH|nr:class I SAM-dependent methyltransferase [Roseiarcus fermentans]RBP12217.1 cyclopropane-fatty-acyl-phospholipid synthase [Roseiarcus fermentans]